MLFSHLRYVLAWIISIQTISASPTVDLVVRTQDVPGTTFEDTMHAFRRALSDFSKNKRDTVLKNSTSLEKSWDGAVLLSYETEVQKGVSKNENVTIGASVNIICTTCYLKANATAEITIAGDFNATKVLSNFTDQIGSQIQNTTDTVIDFIQNYTTNVLASLGDGIDASDFDFPPMDVDFNIVVPDVPEVVLRFQFDGMELYVMLDTILGAGVTYTLNLYSSNTPIGISLSDKFQLGVIFAVDLILEAKAEIDISSGFHIKLDDGTAISIPLFSDNVTDTTFNGGRFEFLPVTIQSAGATLSATLRVGVHAGFEIDTSGIVSAGVEVGVFANVAEFVTNVTVIPGGNDEGCELQVEESYQLAVGAAAGATVAFQGHTWGPAPETVIPLWYTTFAEACAIKGSSTTSNSAQATTLAPRQDLSTATLKDTVTYTGVVCASTGLVNCPVSLQSTTHVTSTKTLITAVPSGAKPTFPATTGPTVVKTIDFGTNVKKIFETTGSPTSFVPTPSSKVDELTEKIKEKAKGVDKKVIIGASVGGGVFLLLLIISGVIFWLRRKRYTPMVPRQGPPQRISMRGSESYNSGMYIPTEAAKKHPNVSVVSHSNQY
ncbi:hypothetical protein B0O99DRAFT_638854 [Bisporella sp. PMI_857]|nr:hypothetical protein B0O99DRAFT_638854 [Bisporella sp. PMI_857]